jgi:hypothetical protein
LHPVKPQHQTLDFEALKRMATIMGTINGFSSFTHPVYGEQHTVTVRLAESNELVSAFLSGWLQEGMNRKQAAMGDLILIQFFGKQAGERFNRFHLEIQKINLKYVLTDKATYRLWLVRCFAVYAGCRPFLFLLSGPLLV